MSPILTGVIASGISGNLTPPWSPEGAYDALATVSLSTDTASITFAGIPSGYKHLQIAGLSRANTGGTNDVTTYLRFNGNSSSVYSTHRTYGYGGGGGGSYDASSSTTQISFGSTLEGGNTANCFSAVFCDILDYSSNSKFKTTMSLSGAATNSLGMVYQTSGNWRNTTPINSITLSLSTGSFAANTSFELYGVK
jgi:hypothetical protein